MMSLNRSIFLSNAGISSSSSPFTGRQRGSVPSVPSSLRVVAVNSNRDRNGSVLTETTRKDVRDGAGSSSSAIDADSKSTVAPGGPHDVYDEDAATKEQVVTPWFVSVASGYTLLRDPHHNKGLAFTDKERGAHYLRGLLPPTVVSQELQVKKMMHIIRQYQVPLQKYMAMMDLQESNEKLFYKLLIDNVEEMLPIVYTPTVGEACQKYGSIFGRPQGLYISLKEKGCIHEVLRNWPEKNIEVIVVTDGERILGLGDLGCQGMGIPVGKLALYTALGGVRPSACLPVTIDVGTNNENLLNDEYYIGLRQRRATGQEYAELLHEFMSAVKQTYGEKVLIQFEDFANHNAFDLLAKYSTTHLVFNDDIQGTASVVLAGLVASLKVVGGTLADHTFLFLGAGEAGTGIAELIALEISKQTNMPVEETRKKVWLVDSKGLIVSSRRESLQHFKKPWAHEHEPVKTLLDAVNDIKPTVLIGTSGVGRTFTKEVIEAMASFNEKPIILSLSNPTSQSECTAEEAYTWSQGRAIFASGSPFAPLEYEGKTFVPGQANNAYIFPGLGLGLIMSGAIRVHDDMLLAASEALAAQVTQENFDKGLIYPPFKNIRRISAEIAAKVAAKAYELGLATRLPMPKDLVKHAESCMYSPAYQTFRNNGHNSRTCPTRSSLASTSPFPLCGVKLFGVRLTDGSIVKKSASMGNLSAHFHSSSSAAASPNPDSPVSDRVHDDGYLSDDPAAHASCSTSRRGDRKKGVPWTEEEHRLFLIGLQKLGKGDWRGIARNFVVSRTPTQVASHAQKFFIRQSNATRRKRRSSLFDMVPEMATDPKPVPEEQELPSSSRAGDADNVDALPALNLSLKPEVEPMDTESHELVKESDKTVMGFSEFKPSVPSSNEFVPIASGSNEFTAVPGFSPAYMPLPYPYWAPNTTPFEEVKGAATSHHEVLKPVPIILKEPFNVDQLVGMSHLSLGEIERRHREPSSLSLKLIGEPQRQSAFHARAPSGSDLSNGKASPIQAV